jgi:hypothetical protein
MSGARRPRVAARDGILKRPATDPYVFQIDSSTEFWQMRASLNASTPSVAACPFPPASGCTVVLARGLAALALYLSRRA